MKKVIITGATSGIGYALAQKLLYEGYMVAATGRRTDRLRPLKEISTDRLVIQHMDVSDTKRSRSQFNDLVTQLGSLDILVLNAGVGSTGEQDEWETQQTVIDVNIAGFAALASAAYELFLKQGYGHLVGISSIAGLFGYASNPTYNASKAFVSTYLQGYRQRARRSSTDITVTDIKPGFIHTEMTRHRTDMFWTATPETAARQMVNIIEKKAHYGYVTHRWRMVAWLLGVLPQRLFDYV